MNETLFLQEVLNIPDSLKDTLDTLAGTAIQIGTQLLGRGARRLVAVGDGSSLYAGVASAYLHNRLVPPDGTLAWAAPAGDYALYPAPLSPTDALIGVSVSGEVVDLLELFRARQGQHQLVGITNVPGSSLTRLVEWSLVMQAGPSLVPTTTKGFVTSIAALDLLWLGLLQAQGVSAAGELMRELIAIPQAAARAAEQVQEQIADAVERVASCSRFYVCGAGPALGIAQEMALVLKEVAGLPAEAVQAREMAHGMISIAGPDLGVIVINPPGRGQAMARRMLAQFASCGAATLEFTSGAWATAEPGQICLDVPCHDLLTPFVYSGPAFMLANELAGVRGVDTDHPAWEAQYLREVRR